MHSVFAENLNLSQSKVLDTQNHSIHYLKCGKILCLNTLLGECTLPYHFAKVYATLLLY